MEHQDQTDRVVDFGRDWLESDIFNRAEGHFFGEGEWTDL